MQTTELSDQADALPFAAVGYLVGARVGAATGASDDVKADYRNKAQDLETLAVRRKHLEPTFGKELRAEHRTRGCRLT